MAPQQSGLLGDDGVDEIRVRFWKIEQLLYACHQSQTKDSTGADGDQRLDNLETITKWVFPWVEEHQQSATSVVGARKNHVEKRDERDRYTEQISIAETCREDHRADDEQDGECCTEVWLEQDQPADATRDHNHGQQRIGHLVDPAHPSFQDRRREDDYSNLGQLGWLHPDSTDTKPPPGPIDGRTEKYRYQRGRRKTEDRPDHRRLFEVSIVHLHGCQQQTDTKHRPRDLLEEKQVRLLIAVPSRGRRRRCTPSARWYTRVEG